MDPDRYLNRELSWLDFNARVLALARRPSLPLLARVKFLAIWATNLDEFFQVRVAGLKEQIAQGVRTTPPDGLTPGQQLEEVRRIVTDQYAEVSKCFLTDLAPALAEAGVVFSDYDTLDEEDKTYLDEQFRDRVYPVVTPLAVDPSHPFPYISNLSLNLAISVRDPETGVSRFARLKVPPILPRFVVLPDGERFVPLEQVIAFHLASLFPGMEILSHHVFRVTRNADIEIEEEEGGDLLMTMESELTRRRFGHVVRLEVAPEMPDDVLDLLMREMGAEEGDVYRLEGPIDLAGLWGLTTLDHPELDYDPWHWLTPMRLQADGVSSDVFAVIRRGDLLVHHPYDSFTSSVEVFLDQAAHDPEVLAIKLTLYRTSRDSPIMRSLIDAAESGKQVVALVELKARFDEERNIEWAQRLEDAGVHVMYGVVGLKTHTKLVLVVRDESGTIRRYAHIGTGNYNEATARIYEDVGLFTADDDIGADLSDLFNFLTGYSRQTRYRAIIVSPDGIRRRMLELIGEQMALGSAGHITMKMNSLVDAGMIEALYEASSAGVRIELIVRGICCLRPGVPGISDNITVRSIVGRYLEHSRIYRFGARGGSRRTYLIGSADLMPRNLDRRVEALVPVDDATSQFRIDEMLDALMADDVLAWELDGETGDWHPVPEVHGVNSHDTLQDLAVARSRVS